jgi:Family of unknown function (DUF5317)
MLGGIALGLVFGVVTGGHVTNLARLKFRWPLLIVVAILIREALLVTPLSRVDGAQYVYLVALAGIVAWTVWHFDLIRGIWLVSIGAALNLLVIAFNGGHMPVAAEAAGPLIGTGTIGPYTIMGPGTNLSLLGDWIRLYPLNQVYSPGDVLIAIGLAVVTFIAVRNPTAYSELTPP